MPFFNSPSSFRASNGLSDGLNLESAASWHFQSPSNNLQSPIALKHSPLPPHASHPGLAHLTMLVFEAVLEVVCVSLPGYIIARQGMFTAEMQKFTANLNVALFTPCLSMYTQLLDWLLLRLRHSFHQARFTIDGGQTGGSRHHPSHIYCSDLGVVSVRAGACEAFWLCKETSELRDCHGGEAPACANLQLKGVSVTG